MKFRTYTAERPGDPLVRYGHPSSASPRALLARLRPKFFRGWAEVRQVLPNGTEQLVGVLQEGRIKVEESLCHD